MDSHPYNLTKQLIEQQKQRIADIARPLAVLPLALIPTTLPTVADLLDEAATQLRNIAKNLRDIEVATRRHGEH